MSVSSRIYTLGSVLVISAFIGIILHNMAEHGIFPQKEAEQLGGLLSLWILATIAVAASDLVEWYEDLLEPDGSKLWYAYGVLGILVFADSVMSLDELNGLLGPIERVAMGILIGLIATWPIVADALEDTWHRLDDRFEGGLS